MDNQEAVRVLHVLTGLSNGGAESFIMNMYRNIDRNKVQFDFLLRSNENVFKEELEKMGSRVFTTASFPRHFIQNALQTSRFFKEHHYDVIHVHANALLYTYALSCAKKNGVKCRIIHSHNSAMAHMQLLPIHNANKRRIHKLATDYFACSDAAGKWMFNGGYTLVHNAIDLADFAYSAQKRAQIKEKLDIKDGELVIGHVGRFTEQKNHDFLIEVFNEIVKSGCNAKLLLVGDGPLKQAMEKKADELRLADRVLFLGPRKDVATIINAFDIFAFPSVYEGLPIALLEAQANGLPIICADAISKQTIFGGTVNKLPLTLSAKSWAERIMNADFRRIQVTDNLQAAGYDIRIEARKLQEFYLSKVKM